MPCGTRAAYERHRRHGEKPCDACRKANAEMTHENYLTDKYGFRTRQRAFIRALTRLGQRHEAQRRELQTKERLAEIERAPNMSRADKHRLYSRVLVHLSRIYPEEFATLLAEEKQHEMRDMQTGHDRTQ